MSLTLTSPCPPIYFLTPNRVSLCLSVARSFPVCRKDTRPRSRNVRGYNERAPGAGGGTAQSWRFPEALILTSLEYRKSAMSKLPPKVLEAIAAGSDDYLDRLFELLRIPSVSADPAFSQDVYRAAKWMTSTMESMGLQTQLIKTPTHPIVLAESPKVPDAPTVLVYGHFDVQPADPLEEWISHPYDPTIRDGKIYARGATDDKGQMLTHIFSTEAWLKTEGALPVNLKFLIEGEEESGSVALSKLMNGDFDDQLGCPVAEKLACDVVVISDSSQFGPEIPAITYGLRGIVAFELTLYGPKQDLHSGTFGGAVANPLNALMRVMAAFQDDFGKVLIPGFYDDVVDLTETERRQWQSLPFSEEEFMQQVGVRATFGEPGYSTIERCWSRPTMDINGISGGYQGEGGKTIVPAKASAKFTCRLVPNQNAEKVANSVRQLVQVRVPQMFTYQLKVGHATSGLVVPLDSPHMLAASDAIESAFGKPPVMIRSGGSIPIVSQFKEKLGVDTLLLGWGQNDDNTHSPNEKFEVADFQRGILASAHLWQALADRASM